MRTTQTAQQKIKSFEGLRLYAYKDAAGVWTCGYGHTKGVCRSTRFSPYLAELRFQQDLQETESMVERLEDEIGQLTAGQFDAIVSFVFNIGWSKFSTSTLYKMISMDKTSPLIGEQFKRWIYCNKKPLQGLIDRRKWESIRYYE